MQPTERDRKQRQKNSTVETEKSTVEPTEKPTVETEKPEKPPVETEKTLGLCGVQVCR